MSTRRTGRFPTALARSGMRVLVTLLGALLVSCTQAPPVIQPTPVPTREPNTVVVSVLLDLSGSRAPNGTPQRDAMQLWLDQAQPATPNVKLRVKFVDVGGSVARVLLEVRRAAVDDHADAIVVGVPAPLDDAFAQAALVANVPILITVPVAEPLTTTGGRWIFSLAPTPDTLSRVLVDDLVARGVRAPSLLVSDESAASVAERVAFAAELGRHGFMAPSPVLTTQGDAAQKIRAGVSVAKSVVFAGAAGTYADAIRGIPVGPDSPRVYLPYLTEIADVSGLREQSALVTWPGSRSLATLSVTPSPGGRAVFVRAFADRHGAPSTLAATAYDALAMIDAVAELAPSELDAAHLRLRLETLTFAGVVTRYAFTPTRHVGFASEDLAYLRWNADRSAPFLAADTKENAK